MLQQKKIVIAGGSGYIGQAMAACWAAGNEIVILTRHAADANNNTYGRHTAHGHVREVYWDAQHTGAWAQELEGADILINLAGRSVNCRYTAANKKQILESRVVSTRTLAAAIQQLQQPPGLWINGASATIYRHATDRP